MPNALDLVGLSALMRLSAGRLEVVIGLIDGPVAMDRADLAGNAIRELPGRASGACSKASSVACLHGTFMRGILRAKRGSPAPAICPAAGPLDHCPTNARRETDGGRKSWRKSPTLIEFSRTANSSPLRARAPLEL
jgi:hypothetical protein